MLRHPHPDVPLNIVEYDTINALAKVASTFKREYNKIPAPDLIDLPLKATENKRRAVLIQPVLKSPIKHTYQTSSQTEVHKVPAHISESRDS
jgi:hypothetical protein